MDYGVVGFFLGGAPGAALVIRNVWRAKQLQDRVISAAWRNKDWGSTQLRRVVLPNRYINPNDSPDVVEAKRKVIAEYPQMLRRHWVGFLIAFFGAAAGCFLGNLVG